jgi:hypothetical protein
MPNPKSAVCGIYTSRDSLERAADTLVRSGFHSSNVSVLLPENLGRRATSAERATKGPEGAAMGAGSGAVLGGTLGLLAGIGALAIPGGPFIAAGPIMAALAGVGIGGAVGGVAGALVGMGIPEYEARRYEGRLQRGGILLSLHCNTPNELTRAREIMQRTGAQDISATGETWVDTKNAAATRSQRAANH